MPKIDDIRQAMSEKDAHEKEMRILAKNIALDLADGFRKYVGLPKTYASHEGPSKPYVEFIKVHPENEELTDRANHVSEAITIFYDGSIHFGVGLILDLAANKFPKRCFTFYVVCQVEGDKLAVNINKYPVIRSSKANTLSGYDMQPAHDAWYEIIMNHFNSRVGDSCYQKEIGFGIRPA